MFARLLLLLAFIGFVYTQCDQNTDCVSCVADTANGCGWCLLTPTFGSCKNSTECSFGDFVDTCPCSSFPFVGGDCQTQCLDLSPDCMSCVDGRDVKGCVNATAGENCTAPQTKESTCPSPCDPRPTPNDMCEIVNTDVPFGSVDNCGQLNSPPNVDNNQTANCSDPCVSDYTEGCAKALQAFSCSISCSNCDASYTLLKFAEYGPCESVCADITNMCSKEIMLGCVDDSIFTCTNASTCTTNKVGPNFKFENACSGTGTAATTGSQTTDTAATTGSQTTGTAATVGNSTMAATNTATNTATNAATNGATGNATMAATNAATTGAATTGAAATGPAATTGSGSTTTGSSDSGVTTIVASFALILLSILF